MNKYIRSCSAEAAAWSEGRTQPPLSIAGHSLPLLTSGFISTIHHRHVVSGLC